MGYLRGRCSPHGEATVCTFRIPSDVLGLVDREESSEDATNTMKATATAAQERDGDQNEDEDDDEEEDYDEKDTGIGNRDAELLEGAEVASIRTNTGINGEGSIRSRAESAASRASGTGSGRTGTLSRKTTSSGDAVSIMDVDNLSLAESK